MQIVIASDSEATPRYTTITHFMQIVIASDSEATSRYATITHFTQIYSLSP
jgi:hypothetical protein